MAMPTLSRYKELVATGTLLKQDRLGNNLRTTSTTRAVYPGNMTMSEIEGMGMPNQILDKLIVYCSVLNQILFLHSRTAV